MNKLKKNATHIRRSVWFCARVLLVFLLVSGCNSGSHNDRKVGLVDTFKAREDSSLEKVADLQDTVKRGKYVPPEISEEAMQRAVISKRDSIFHVYSNIRADYRIIGYELPDTNARKMVLFSVFTSDVKDNPFKCPYGSYYDSAQRDELVIKYIGEQGSFIEAHISGNRKKPATVYFEKKWIEFDE
jgi:hypothetical protein